MFKYWLDPLFLEMFFDRFLRGTVLVWQAVWQPVIWLLLGLLASLFCARRPAHAHRLLLLACLAAVLTPLLSAVVERMNWGIFLSPASEPTYVLLAPNYTPSASPEFVPAIVSRPFSINAALLWAWLALSVLCAARLLLSLGRGWRLIARAKPLHEPRLQSALETAARKLGLPGTPALCTSDQVRSPVIYCWAKRPVLLLPTVPLSPLRGREAGGEGANLSDAAWVAIFCHELAHCQRRDHRASLLTELLVVLMPWNPLAWRLKRRLGYMAERTCDDWVLDAGEPAADYAEALLQLVPQRGPALALAAVSGRQTLKARIRNILRRRHPKPRVGRVWSALIGTATTAAVLLMALAQAATENPAARSTPAPITLSGQVLAADGRPLAGAGVVVMTCPWLMVEPEKLALHTGYEVLAQGTTTEDGRFQLRFDAQAQECPGQESFRVNRDLKGPSLPLHLVAAASGHGLGWLPIHYPLEDQADLKVQLPPEQLIHGRLIDLQGQPAAQVRLEVLRVGTPTFPYGGFYRYGHEMNRIWVLLLRTQAPVFQIDYDRMNTIQFWTAAENLPAWPAPVITDAQGRFVLRGIGPEHGVGVVVRDERYAYQLLNIEPQSGKDLPVTFALPPASIIEGTVKDEETGLPVAGALIHAESPSFNLPAEDQVEPDWKGRPRSPARHIFGPFEYRFKLPNFGDRTDARGRFRIQVYNEPDMYEQFLGPRNQFAVWVHGPDGHAYLDVRRELSWPKGVVRQKIDIALPRGVLVRGQVREDRYGQPIAGARVDCWSKGFKLPPEVLPPGPVQTGRNGVFQVVLPPTHWHLLVNAHEAQFTSGLRREIGLFEIGSFIEEPIEIERLTDIEILLKARKPDTVSYKEIGRPPSYYPDAWLALDLKPGDPPQALRVVLRHKEPLALTWAK